MKWVNKKTGFGFTATALILSAIECIFSDGVPFDYLTSMTLLGIFCVLYGEAK